MKNSLPTALVILGMATYGTANATSWLCIGDQATGFSKGKDGWKGAVFSNASEMKIVIRGRNATDEPMLYKGRDLLAFKHGQKPPIAGCVNNIFVIDCDGFARITFRPGTLRFSYASDSGYILEETRPEKGSGRVDDTFMVIGKCSVIE